MKRFIISRSLLVVATSIFFVNVICSQITAVSLTSTGELLVLTVKTDVANIAITSDFSKAKGKDTLPTVRYENGKVKQLDNFSFSYYSKDTSKIHMIGSEEFSYYDNAAIPENRGKFKSINGIDIVYYKSGANIGKIQRINHEFLQYTDGKLSEVSCFIENEILFWVHDSKADFDRMITNKDDRNEALISMIFDQFLAATSSTTRPAPLTHYSRDGKSNYFRIKKERQVLKFREGACIKIVYDGDGSVSSVPVDCSLYSGNYKLVRDEIIVLKYDDQVCFRGEMMDGESLVFERRKCPKGKERARLKNQ